MHYFCGVKIKEAVRALENFAPLSLQESYDNAGLQIGLTERELSGALLCLDVTEEVVRVAEERGCNLIVAHHPLLFHGLKRISDGNYIERIVMRAIKQDIAIYAAHTNLDNAFGGVNFYAAEKLGLKEVAFLHPLESGLGGSGAIGDLPEAMSVAAFLKALNQAFNTQWMMHSPAHTAAVRRVAMCMGAGSSFLKDAVQAGADVFITGEMGHHAYFDYTDRIMVCALGHYQSEIHVVELLAKVLSEACPTMRIETFTATNPEEIFTEK